MCHEKPNSATCINYANDAFFILFFASAELSSVAVHLDQEEVRQHNCEDGGSTRLAAAGTRAYSSVLIIDAHTTLLPPCFLASF